MGWINVAGAWWTGPAAPRGTREPPQWQTKARTRGARHDPRAAEQGKPGKASAAAALVRHWAAGGASQARPASLECCCGAHLAGRLGDVAVQGPGAIHLAEGTCNPGTEPASSQQPRGSRGRRLMAAPQAVLEAAHAGAPPAVSQGAAPPCQPGATPAPPPSPASSLASFLVSVKMMVRPQAP